MNLLMMLGIDGSVLMILDDKFSNSEEGSKAYVAGKNISFLHIISQQKASSFMIMKNKWLIMTKKAVEELNGKIGNIVEESIKTEKKVAKKKEVEE